MPGALLLLANCVDRRLFVSIALAALVQTAGLGSASTLLGASAVLVSTPQGLVARLVYFLRSFRPMPLPFAASNRLLLSSWAWPL